MGATSIGHDGWGNLTASGTVTSGYSKLKELLTTAGGGASVDYDGAGRMVSYAAGSAIRARA